jgi:U3 small nucleolar RNA-associated protein 20
MAHKNFTLTSLLGLSLESLVAIVKKKSSYLEKLYSKHDVIQQLLSVYGRNEVIVKALYEYMAMLHSRYYGKGNGMNGRPVTDNHLQLSLHSDMKGDHFELQALEQVYPVLKANLRSYLPKCRLYTVKLLSLFDQPLMKKDSDHRLDEPCEIVGVTLKMESIVPSMNEFRDKLILIQKLNLICSTKRIPDLYVDFVPLVAFGKQWKGIDGMSNVTNNCHYDCESE